MRNWRSWLMALVGLLLLGPREARSQQEYTITGNEAWNVAKTYGFEFYPQAGTGESVTRPYDGVYTKLTGFTLSGLRSSAELRAYVQNGNAVTVRPGSASRTVTYRMFYGKTLQPGWTIQRIVLDGSHTFAQTPRYGTADASYRVSVTAYPSSNATVKLQSLTLRGPAGADWRDAFAAPQRREFTVDGITAWSTAKMYGFSFAPSYCSSCGESLQGPLDGVDTHVYKIIPLLGKERIASVVGGNMIVEKTNTSKIFRMYIGKKLASGWKIKSVQISGGTWTRQPAYGTDDMSFEVSLRSYSSSTNAHVRSVVLEGPSNAASWQDAFKGAR